MKETIKQTLQSEWFLVKLMFRTDAICGVIYWLITGTQYAIPLVSVWLWKLILDELTVIFYTKTANNIIWVYLGIYLTLQVISSVVSQANSVIYDKIKRKASYSLDMAIMSKMAQMDTAYFDNPKNNDLTEAAQTSEEYITGNMPWAIDTIIRIITFIFGLIMFLSYDPIVGLLYITTYIPGAIISFKHKVKVNQWSIDNIPETRKKNYYKFLLTGSYASKDLRLYNLVDYYKEKYNLLWNKIRAERVKMFAKGAVGSFFASLLTYSGIVIIILMSIYSVMSGTMMIGTLALYIGLAQSSGENFGRIVEDLACQIEIDVPYIIQYMNFMNYENIIKDNGKEKITHCPAIEFKDVCFKYMGNENDTIHNLSFCINSGEKIALIGINGAGKTTIVKLLLRFYEPQSGQILIDGKDIREYSIDEIHGIFGVCFQNINCYSLTLRENIGISDVNRMKEIDAITNAAMASGADKISDQLEQNYETDMTRQFNDKGAELSGGQWQKIGLARTFFRDSQFVILDEPSSALDPEAEDYIFSSFKGLCKNKGGILISHRLSSIMMVDKIVLIDNGTVFESGTHETLMKKNGKYAEMYHMQSDKYVSGAKHE